jgi:hypothetical protein
MVPSSAAPLEAVSSFAADGLCVSGVLAEISVSVAESASIVLASAPEQ